MNMFVGSCFLPLVPVVQFHLEDQWALVCPKQRNHRKHTTSKKHLKEKLLIDPGII